MIYRLHPAACHSTTHEMSPAVLRKPRTVLAAALAGLLLVAAVGAASLWASGLRPYVVRSGSMQPTLQPGDVVLARTGQSPGIGDVVTFTLGPAGLVTHRVIDVDGRVLRTKGDANRTADPWSVAPDQVAGTMVRAIPDLGYALVYLRQPTGALSLVAGTVALVLAWQVFFGSEPARPRQPTRRRRPGRRPDAPLVVVTGVTLVAVLAGAALTAVAKPSAAYFSDTRSGTLTVTWTCPDRHDDPPGHGNGHDKCHGSGHVAEPEHRP